MGAAGMGLEDSTEANGCCWEWGSDLDLSLDVDVIEVGTELCLLDDVAFD